MGKGHYEPVRDVVVAAMMQGAKHGNFTISGGEPFAQPDALLELARLLHVSGAESIIVYTGYELFEIQTTPIFDSLAEYVDIVVVGRYIQQQDDDAVTYRGSRNQKPIDMRTGKIINWDDEITITEDGVLVLPLALAEEFETMGVSQDSPMCGEVT